MRFEKYHGLGNDFIIFNMKDLEERDLADLARRVCHRNFGIGADGMIVYERDDRGIVMNFYNADGTTAPMCGNGIRCFTHYMKNNGHFTGDRVRVQTGAGELEVVATEEREFMVRVNMGKPSFGGRTIPINLDTEEYIEEELEVEGLKIKVSSLFMGTTHTVIFVESLEEVDIASLGPKIEKHSMFPVGTNVNFCEVKSREEIHVATWERGAGMTLACGTGACGAAVIGRKLGKIGENVKVVVPGGEMYIEVGEEVFMKGPSVKIAEGEFLLG